MGLGVVCFGVGLLPALGGAEVRWGAAGPDHVRLDCLRAQASHPCDTRPWSGWIRVEAGAHLLSGLSTAGGSIFM